MDCGGSGLLARACDCDCHRHFASALLHVVRSLLRCMRQFREEPIMEELVKRSLSPRTAAYLLGGAAMMVIACSAETNGSSENNLGQNSSALKFCGNGRCDHGETCSTCSQDCGACPDAGGSDASSGS